LFRNKIECRKRQNNFLYVILCVYVSSSHMGGKKEAKKNCTYNSLSFIIVKLQNKTHHQHGVLLFIKQSSQGRHSNNAGQRLLLLIHRSIIVPHQQPGSMGFHIPICGPYHIQHKSRATHLGR